MNKNQLFTLLISAICFSCSPISDDNGKLPNEHGKILSQDTLTMSLSYGCIIDGFLSKPEKSYGEGTYYYRAEATNEEQ